MKVARRIVEHAVGAAVIGFLVTMAGAFLTRFSSIGWLFLPFGMEALGLWGT